MISWLKKMVARYSRGQTFDGRQSVPAWLEAGLDRLCESTATLDDALSALELMRAEELSRLSANSFKPPFHFWWRRLQRDRRKALADAVEIGLAASRSPYDRIIWTALLVRFRLSGDALSALINIQWNANFGVLTPTLAEELCMLLHQERAFPKLKNVCGFALDTLELDHRQKQLFCDWYFQAAYQQVKGRIFRNILTPEDVAAVQEALTFCEGILGADAANVGHYRAVMACVEGDLRTAVDWHTRALDQGGYNSQFFRAARNLVPLNQIQGLAEGNEPDAFAKHAFLKACTFDLRHKKDMDATMVACDAPYFDAYIDGFADSFAHCNPGGLLHVHAIAFVPDAARLDALEARFGIKLNVTHDPGPPKPVAKDIWRGYCAGARYIHLPAYLDRYDRVIVNDIDGIVHLPMKDVWKGREGRIQLSTLALESDRKGHFAFWSNIGAGAFATESIDSHMSFARALSRYLVERYDACLKNGDRFFFTDQVGLLLCVLAFDGKTPMTRMPQIFRQSSQTAQSGRDDAKRAAQVELLKELKADHNS